MRKILIILLFIAIIFLLTSCGSIPSAEEAKKSLKVVDIETKWVEKYGPDVRPWEVVMVPSIKFRLQNVGTRPIKVYYFHADFRFKDEDKSLGYAFETMKQKGPIKPGEKSVEIFIKCPFGYRARSKLSFKNNPNWKPVVVRLFASLGGGTMVDLGTYPIKQVLAEEEKHE